MIDETAARVFGIMFLELARNPDDANRELAHRIYAYTRDFNFTQEKMGCDTALIKLGLYTDEDEDES